MTIPGTGQTEVLTQGAALVLGAENAAFLQFRHYQVDEVLEIVRQQRWLEVEAVRGAIEEPVFDLIGDIRRRTHHRAMPLHRAETHEQIGRASCRGGEKRVR